MESYNDFDRICQYLDIDPELLLEKECHLITTVTFNNHEKINDVIINIDNIEDYIDRCTYKKSDGELFDKTYIYQFMKNSPSGLTKGSCRYCQSYDSYHTSCHRGYYVDFRSYINYECEKAAKEIPNIVVIYNYANVDKLKCPESVRYVGKHINGYYKGSDGKYY